MTDFLVSILIPAYNRASLIRETLTSVINQSYENFECIIIDDGSTDDTKAIIKEFSAKDRRFKIYERDREPKGACSCRNIGVENSCGEYIMFLDSDDLITSACLEERLKVARDKPEYDAWVFPGLHFARKPGDSRLLWNITKKDVSQIKRFLTSDIPWSTTGPLWNAESLKKFNIKWDESLADWQDADIHLCALIKGLQFYEADCLPDYFIRHIYENENERISASDLKEDRILSKMRLFDKWHALINNSDLSITGKNDCNKHLSSYCFLFAERIVKKKIKFDHSILIKKMRDIYRHNKILLIFIKIYLWNLKHLENVFVLRSINYRIIRKCLPGFLFHTESDFRKTDLDHELVIKASGLIM